MWYVRRIAHIFGVHWYESRRENFKQGNIMSHDDVRTCLICGREERRRRYFDRADGHELDPKEWE